VRDDVHDEVEAAKAASTGQLLFRCARLLNDLGLARVRAATGVAIRPAHAALFPHIDLDGTRITEIARRAGVSKQAVGPVIAELVEWGMMERVPDPADGRAHLIRYAVGDDGEHSIVLGLRVLGTLEGELGVETGPGRWAALHDALTALLPALEERHGRMP